MGNINRYQIPDTSNRGFDVFYTGNYLNRIEGKSWLEILNDPFSSVPEKLSASVQLGFSSKSNADIIYQQYCFFLINEQRYIRDFAGKFIGICNLKEFIGESLLEVEESILNQYPKGLYHIEAIPHASISFLLRLL